MENIRKIRYNSYMSGNGCHVGGQLLVDIGNRVVKIKALAALNYSFTPESKIVGVQPYLWPVSNENGNLTMKQAIESGKFVNNWEYAADGFKYSVQNSS